MPRIFSDLNDQCSAPNDAAHLRRRAASDFAAQTVRSSCAVVAIESRFGQENQLRLSERNSIFSYCFDPPIELHRRRSVKSKQFEMFAKVGEHLQGRLPLQHLHEEEVHLQLDLSLLEHFSPEFAGFLCYCDECCFLHSWMNRSGQPLAFKYLTASSSFPFCRSELAISMSRVFSFFS